MKRINLITPKRYFPVPISLQKKVIAVLFIIFFATNVIKYYFSYTELKNETNNIAILESDIAKLKQTLAKKRALDEKVSFIENEFANIKLDYDVLKKNVIIKDIMVNLSELTPHNTWITSLNFSYDGEKKLYIDGKSYNKDEVFTFLKNLSAIGRNQELSWLNRENEKGYFIFQITVEFL